MVNDLKVQLRVITAIMLRETKTLYGHSKIGYLWALLEPAMHMIGFWILYALAGKANQHYQGLNLPVFLLSGIIPYQLFSSTTFKCMAAIKGNRALLSYPQVTILDLVIARAILDGSTLVVVFCVLLAVLNVLGFSSSIVSLALLLQGLSSAWLLGTSFGLVMASVSAFRHSAEKITGTCMRFMHFTSGVFFSTDILPPDIRKYLLINPLLHAVEISRAGFSAALYHSYSSIAYVNYWSISLLFIGLVLERRVRREIEYI